MATNGNTPTRTPGWFRTSLNYVGSGFKSLGNLPGGVRSAVYGLAAVAALYTVTTPIACIVNSGDKINPNGIERTILTDNEGTPDEKNTSYVSFPYADSHTDFRLNKDGKSGTSLAYRLEQDTKNSLNTLKDDKAKAQSNYDAAAKKINGDYDEMTEKSNEAKKAFGFKTKSKQKKRSASSNGNLHETLDELDVRLRKKRDGGKK